MLNHTVVENIENMRQELTQVRVKGSSEEAAKLVE